LSLTESVTRKAKTDFARPRPFSTDETLTTAVRRPAGATSYPSSHSSRAFAAATVLGSLWPHAASDLVQQATDVAASRPYAGVHFPSDVAVGAMIGTAVGKFVATGSGVT
jgi:undecaprenyl-diphosphatase